MKTAAPCLLACKALLSIEQAAYGSITDICCIKAGSSRSAAVFARRKSSGSIPFRIRAKVREGLMKTDLVRCKGC